MEYPAARHGADHGDDRVACVLARSARALTGQCPGVWSRLEALLRVVDVRSAPVLANVAALLTMTDDADLRAAADLVADLGEEGLARRQLQSLRRLEGSDGRRLMTLLIRRLWAGPCDRDVEGAAALRSSCRAIAGMLLVQEIEIDPPPARQRVASGAELARLAVRGGVTEWRPYLAEIVLAPWGPHASLFRQFAAEAGGAEALGAADRLIDAARAAVSAQERRQVAEQVRRLVHGTGLPQREFAAMVGTSPSRLSTYVSGRVVPSAAMLVRIVRTARAWDSGRAAAPEPGASRTA